VSSLISLKTQQSTVQTKVSSTLSPPVIFVTSRRQTCNISQSTSSRHSAVSHIHLRDRHRSLLWLDGPPLPQAYVTAFLARQQGNRIYQTSPAVCK